MKHIRPSYLAPLAMVVATVATVPANACPTCPSMAPISAAPPSPSVRPPNVNVNVPRVEVPNIRDGIKTGSGGDGSTGKTPAKPPKVAKTPPKVLNANDYEEKMNEMSKAAERQNREKGLNLTPEQLAELVLQKMNEKYKMQAWKDAQEEEQARRAKEWKANQAKWKAADEEKAKQEAEEKARREAANKPVPLHEFSRRARVNRGEIPPGPGDEGQPWFNPRYQPGETPWNK